jgi:hypothetical protein
MKRAVKAWRKAGLACPHPNSTILSTMSAIWRSLSVDARLARPRA